MFLRDKMLGSKFLTYTLLKTEEHFQKKLGREEVVTVLTIINRVSGCDLSISKHPHFPYIRPSHKNSPQLLSIPTQTTIQAWGFSALTSKHATPHFFIAT